MVEKVKVTKEEAKFYRDKHILETPGHKLADGTKEGKATAVHAAGVSPENYDKIVGKPKENNPARVFNIKNQADMFNEIQPIFYDKNGLWWLWDKDSFKWEIVDEVDILNMVSESTGRDVITTRNRTEIINSLKQKGRLNIPKPAKKTWVQFKDTIVDIKTGEEIKASPKYFITNPIPYELHQERYVETPVMDNIFSEWVGEDNVKLLHEIIAYSLLPDYPIHRLFCFVGGGMNGKSCFLRLISKFIGKSNITSTELDTLLNSRFEITKLHKKLVCVMGETNFSEISRTSILKKLTGQDPIGFEYKNKNPFDELNYAKILIATNSLPTTTDKTIGFYRRWSIIDFPNQFSEQRDILSDIPEEEYEILAVKSLFILKDLLETRRFHNEGSIEDRILRYENKSDFLHKFIEDYIKEDSQEYITKSAFNKKFSEWCIENRHRKLSDRSVALKMRDKGYEDGKKHLSWLYDGKGGDARVWFGITWKD